MKLWLKWFLFFWIHKLKQHPAIITATLRKLLIMYHCISSLSSSLIFYFSDCTLLFWKGRAGGREETKTPQGDPPSLVYTIPSSNMLWIMSHIQTCIAVLLWNKCWPKRNKVTKWLMRLPSGQSCLENCQCAGFAEFTQKQRLLQTYHIDWHWAVIILQFSKVK